MDERERERLRYGFNKLNPDGSPAATWVDRYDQFRADLDRRLAEFKAKKREIEADLLRQARAQ